MIITHLTDPKYSHRATKGKVHFENPDDKGDILCGHQPVFIDPPDPGGEPIRILHPTKQKVTCRACRLRLEVAMRERLYLMNTEQLEALLEATNGMLWETEA